MSEKENVVSNKTHMEELIMFLFEVLKVIPSFFRSEKRDRSRTLQNFLDETFLFQELHRFMQKHEAFLKIHSK